MHKVLGVLLGVAMVAIGLVVIFSPDHGLNLVAWLLGVILIVGGVVRLVFALFSSGPEVESRWGIILAGALMILVGIIVVRNLRDALDAIVWITGLLWILVGIIEFFAVLGAREWANRGIGLAMAATTLVFGIVLVAWPEPTNDVLAIIVGIYLALGGIMQVASALRTKPEPGVAA